MFPSGGYFRSANCPFFQHGLCHRPYCHFRHSKPEYKPSKLSCTAKKNESEKEQNGEVDDFLQDKDKVTNDAKRNSSFKQKVEKKEQDRSDKPSGSSKTIFKRTALEEKLIAFSRSTDELSSDSDIETETEKKENKDRCNGLSVDENIKNSLASQEDKAEDGVSRTGETVVKTSVAECEETESDTKSKPESMEIEITTISKPESMEIETATTTTSRVESKKIETKTLGEKVESAKSTSQAESERIETGTKSRTEPKKIETVQASEPEKTQQKKVTEKHGNSEADALPCSKGQNISFENVNEQQNPVTSKSSEKDKLLEEQPTQEMLADLESIFGKDDECWNKVDEKLKVVTNTELVQNEIHETTKGIEIKEGEELNTMIEDLQKYGTGINVRVKSKKENIADVSKIKKEKPKPEPPKLSDVNFFSPDVLKVNKKKRAKEEKTGAAVMNKEEKMSKSKKKLKETLSESNLATTKEKSKIQRYKELKRLVTDSEKIINATTDSASRLVDNKDSKIGSGTKDTKLVSKEFKKNVSNEESFRKDKNSDKAGENKILKEQVKVANREADVPVKSLKHSSSKCGRKDVLGKAEQSKTLLLKNNAKKTDVMGNYEEVVVPVSSDSERSSEEAKKSHVIGSDIDNSMEDDSEEFELLRIFNDYDPDGSVNDDGTSDITNIKNDSDDIMQSLPKSMTGLKRPFSESIPAGFKKQRVAHQPNMVIERPIASRNNSTTFQRLPRPLQGTLAPPTRQIVQPQGDRDLVASTHVKQRVTHYSKSSGTLFNRPRIRLEYGAKVPQNMRQRYLDRLVDEYLCVFEDQQEAFDKAEKEEKEIYLKSPRRQMYTNLCINRIKTLRDAISQPEVMPVKRNPLACKSTLPVSPTKRLKIDPSAAANVATVINNTEHNVGFKSKKEVKDDDMTEDEFYSRMQKYILSVEELEGNGYPRPSSIPGHAEITECYSKLKRSTSDPTRHICCRCGKPFVVLESGLYPNKEECVYHYGRLLRTRTAGEIVTSYTCCQGESGCMGCSVSKRHVRQTYWSEETGFAGTRPNPESTKKIFALDCEMCYTTRGLELTRVTVVDYKCQQVYDTLVKPENDIVDYNTRFSGITEEIMIGVTMSLRDVQSVLLRMFYEDTILIGHSLESDLRSLKIIHSTVVDTAIVFPHRLGLPYKRALKTLMGEYVKKIIQDNETGHDSLEDAVSCVELMLWRVKEDMKIKERKK